MILGLIGVYNFIHRERIPNIFYALRRVMYTSWWKRDDLQMNLTAPWRLACHLLAGFSIRVVQSLVMLQPISFCVYFSVKCLSCTHNKNYFLAFFPSCLLSLFSPTTLLLLFLHASINFCPRNCTNIRIHMHKDAPTIMHVRIYTHSFSFIHSFVFFTSIVLHFVSCTRVISPSLSAIIRLVTRSQWKPSSITIINYFITIIILSL